MLLINGKSYVLLSVIGRGGSSKVYEALGPDMKMCAVKCVNIDVDDEQTIASYYNEISLLQRLQHCCQIVHLIDQYAQYFIISVTVLSSVRSAMHLFVLSKLFISAYLRQGLSKLLIIILSMM